MSRDQTRPLWRCRLAPSAGLALTLAGTLAVSASPAAMPLPDGASPKPRFEHLTNRDGLSQNTVFAIEQDRQGFLWLGTKVGLNRYDGYDFKIYAHDPYNPDTLAKGFVRVVLEDRGGALWIGTYDGGLDRFDPATETFTHYRHDPADPSSLTNDDVRAIFEDRAGTLWVGTRRGGLNRFEPESRTFTHFRHDPEVPSSLADDDVRAIFEDSSGKLWIGTQGGLARFDGGGRFTRFRHDPDDFGSLVEDRVRVICEDRPGRLWIGTNGGLDRFDPATGSFTHYRHDPGDPRSLSGDRVRSCHVDRSGRLWIGTRAGLDRLDGEGFSHYRHDPDDPSSLSDAAVYSIHEDRSGGLWIGTYNGGLNRFDPDAEVFLHVRHDPRDSSSLGGSQVTSLHADRSGRLWAGTFGGGVGRIAADQLESAFIHYRHDPQDPVSLADDRVRAVLEDRAGRLWVGLYSAGLERLDPAAAGFIHYRHDRRDPASLSSDYVRCLFEDQAGRLWIGTQGGGLNRFDGAAGFTRYRNDPKRPSSLAHDGILTISQDRAGTLWVGTYGGGLERFDDQAETFSHYRHDAQDPRSLSHDAVSAILEDRAGRLWVGTYGGGLNRLDRVAPDRVAPDRVAPDRVGPDGQTAVPATFVHYTKADGLGDNTVFGILEDRLGRLWISTNRGLARFDPDAERWTGYDVRDGLQGVEFNQGAADRGRHGEMYFGGDSGFNVFFPERFEDNAYVPPVVLTSFKVFEREIDLGPSSSHLEQIDLEFEDNFFAFEFAVLNFRRPDRNRYRYRLEGLDEDWVDPGARRYASYTNVPPGEYLFRVKGSNNDGLWNEEGTSVRLQIHPPPWRSWWAYGIYLAALVAAVAAGARWHRSRRERSRAVAEHEREIHRRLRQADRQKSELIGELEAKNTELERFTYTVSHDLKSPLLTIKGFLGLVRKDASAGDEKRLEHDLERLEAAADKMTGLLDDLLQLSRVGRQVNTLGPVAMASLASEAVSLLAAEIAERGVEVEIAPGMPRVVGDSNRLVQVIQNLLQNAIKYMGSQPSPRVVIGARPAGDGDEPVFFVRDNGLGIEPDDRDKVFGLFQRLDKGGEGTGVGLALVKRIVEVHGGRIWVESEGRFQGSTFCFTLPRQMTVADER